MEGTRPILVEMQALVSETNMHMASRTAVGIDNQRLRLMLAVLEKKLKAPFFKYDVYVNVVGGLNLDGTTGDLGLALALLSSLKNTGFKLERAVIIGEVGLTGEIRPIASCDRLIKEAEKMGFKNAIIPNRNKDKVTSNEINIIGVSNIREAINKIF